MPTDPRQSAELQRLAALAMSANGLQPDFTADALQQANAVKGPVTEADASIRDLRALLWSSIDNDDSRDLDQIEVAERLADGSIRVLVAIADVDATVRPGSPIDQHARQNTTSVYTAARIFPMLPERLSTNLTSLAEDQERLAIVFEMSIAPAGTLGASSIYRARVVNRAQLAYPGVAAWLEGTGPAPGRVASLAGLADQLHLQDEAAQRLKQLRHDHGALTLETLEARAVFDDGLLVDLRPDPKNRAQELIEDLMIAANGVSARYLAAQNRPSMRRILRAPKRWDRIVALAQGLGTTLPPQPDAVALNGFLQARRQSDPDHFQDLSLAIVKMLGSGEYVVERPGENSTGHFGLAARDYTHSTAPNRRFPDVITQRLLKAALRGIAPPYGEEDLGVLAAHCTTQEDAAAKVERQVRKSAAAMLLGSRVGESFDAIVTGASDQGTYVRISQPAAEGRVVQGFQGLDVGDRVRVKLTHTDTVRGFIDFARVK